MNINLSISFIIVNIGFIATGCKTTQTINDQYKKKFNNFINELNAQYQDPVHSPLTKKDLAIFKTHHFFPYDSNYRVKAKIVKKFNKKEKLIFQTSSGVQRPYYKYATYEFKINGKQMSLIGFESVIPIKDPKYSNHIFLPFKDLTNNKVTYGGGRYIDLQKSTKDFIIIDFNKAYNPFCAYNNSYACPIPPPFNKLPLTINAGIKLLKHTD